ncbi:MAG: M12 family metallopeptidase [Polyangiales bacterium]
MKKNAPLALSLAIAALGPGCLSGPGAPDDGPDTAAAPVVTERAFPGRSGPVDRAIVETPQGARLVGYEVIDDVAVTEGDILLAAPHHAHDPDVARSAGRVNVSYRWPNGQVPFEFDAAIGAAQRADILAAMDHWNQRTPYWFRPRAAGDADFIRFVPSAGCSSFVGRQGAMQPVNLNAACGRGATIHELGHAVGLWHEQSRADRNNFITVNYANVQPGMEFNFDTYVQQGADGRDMFAYDFGSIMHYDAFAFSRNGLPTIARRDGQPLVVQRTALSETDIAGAVRVLTNTQPQPTVTLRNARTGKCMDVADWGRTDGAAVNQFTCHGGANQRWYFWTVPGTSRVLVINDNSGHCLDIPWGTTNGNELLQQFSCHGEGAQQFERVNVGAQFALRRAGTSLCLEADPAGVDSTRLRQVACTYASQQLWAAVP